MLSFHPTKFQYQLMEVGRNIQTVSLAKSSGSSRPFGCLSRSQHFKRTTNSCLIPSKHCNMILAAHKHTPYLQPGDETNKHFIYFNQDHKILYSYLHLCSNIRMLQNWTAIRLKHKEFTKVNSNRAAQA